MPAGAGMTKQCLLLLLHERSQVGILDLVQLLLDLLRVLIFARFGLFKQFCERAFQLRSINLPPGDVVLFAT